MRQPSTGVRGSSAVAMLSSLLNISDSVPPVHMRSATTFHFFPRDLGTRNRGNKQSVRISSSQLSWVRPDPPSLLPTQEGLTFSKLPSGSCADPAGKHSRPQSSPRGCAAASPATRPHRTADTWGPVTTITPLPSPGPGVLTTSTGPCLSPTGPLLRQKWAQRLACLGHTARARQSPGRNPCFG